MLRGALMGVGNAALNGHVPAYLEDAWLREKVEIVAAADLSKENLQVLRVRMPSLKTYRRVEDVFSSDGLDFIDICTPPHVHLEIIRMASQQGYHILCEKPLALHLEDGQEIERLVTGRPIVFVPCHQYRFSPLWRTLHHLVHEGEIGQVHLAQFDVFRLQADSGNAYWKANWRTHPHIGGGGIIFDIGTHYFYLAFSLFGLPERLSARTAQLAHTDYKVEDTALIVLEYPTLVVQINLTWAAEHRENHARLIGTKGNIELKGDTLVLQRGQERREWIFEGASGKAAYSQWYSLLFRDFVRRVETGIYSVESVTEALNALQCAEACYRSAQTGKTLRFANEEA